MELEKKSLDHLEQLLERTQGSFEGLYARWDNLQPRREFDVKMLDFGKMEDDFVGWFYTEHGRSMTDLEYRQFWKKCRVLVRSLHKKYDVFYFQE